MAFKSFASQLTVAVRGKTEEAAKAALQAAVRSEMLRVRSQQSTRSGGIEPELEAMVVDGMRGASIAQIGHNSRVLLDWNYLAEAVIRTVDYLETHGPEISGEWKKSIVTLIDGAEVSRATSLPHNARKAVVAVTAPYGRRLEVGKAQDGTPFAVQVSQHFVERACAALRSQHRDLAKFSFDYVDIRGASRRTTRIGRGASDAEHAARRASLAHNSDVRSPAILIEELQAI
jgi:hypothetical protein